MAPKAKAAAPKASPAAAAPKKDSKPKKEKKEEAPRPEDLIPKVEKPDDKEYEEKTGAIQEKIDKLQEKQKAIGTKISGLSGGKDEYQEKRAALRAELDTWQAKIDELKKQKEELFGKADAQKKEGQAKKAEVDKMKKSIGYQSEDQIDQKISELEHYLATSSMPLREEKKIVADIQLLKKNRPKVAGVRSMEASLGQGDGGAALKQNRQAIGEEMGACIEEKKKVSEKLKELNEKRAQSRGPVDDLIKEREELNTQIRALIEKRNEIRAEKRKKEDEFRAYMAEVRKVRAERAGEERAERQKEMAGRDRQRKADKLDVQPHAQEITLIQQTIFFCKGLVSNKSAEQKEEKKETEYGEMDGCEVLKLKEDREEEFYYVPTAKKKSKSKKGASEGGAKTSNIKHNAETFRLFDQLKLDPPITTGDVPDLLEKLDKMLEEYQEKVKVWSQKREELKRKILAGEEEAEEEQKEPEEKKEEEAATEE